MRFTCFVKINLPVARVVALWNDETNFINWQDGFIGKVLLEGEQDKPGAKSKIIYFQGLGQMELYETIIENKLPTIKKVLYEHAHMVNTQTIKITKIKENESELESEIEYTKFIGLFPKLLALFFPKMFKKQTLKWLNDFKTFAELDSLPFT